MRPVTQSRTRNSSSQAHLRVLSAPVTMVPATRTRVENAVDLGAAVINGARILASVGLAANLAWMYLL